jgi:hypothetical protein
VVGSPTTSPSSCSAENGADGVPETALTGSEKTRPLSADPSIATGTITSFTGTLAAYLARPATAAPPPPFSSPYVPPTPPPAR